MLTTRTAATPLCPARPSHFGLHTSTSSAERAREWEKLPGPPSIPPHGAAVASRPGELHFPGGRAPLEPSSPPGSATARTPGPPSGPTICNGSSPAHGASGVPRLGIGVRKAFCPSLLPPAGSRSPPPRPWLAKNAFAPSLPPGGDRPPGEGGGDCRRRRRRFSMTSPAPTAAASRRRSAAAATGPQSPQSGPGDRGASGEGSPELPPAGARSIVSAATPEAGSSPGDRRRLEGGSGSGLGGGGLGGGGLGGGGLGGGLGLPKHTTVGSHGGGGGGGAGGTDQCAAAQS